MTVVLCERIKINKTENDFLVTCKQKVKEISKQCERGGELDILINQLHSKLTELTDFIEII